MEGFGRTDHAEDGGEEVVDEGVCEAGHAGGAASEESCRGRAWTDGVCDEGGRCAVEVATALELEDEFVIDEFSAICCSFCMFWSI